MSNKRKDVNPGQKQTHPQKSFQDYIADATLAKLGGYIDDQIKQLGQNLLQRQTIKNNNLMLRIMCTEELIMEMNPSITKEILADRVASIQDRLEGFETTEGAAQLGDRVRIELKTRTTDQTEFQGSSRLQVDDLGQGNTLGKELESAVLGMSAGEVKETKFGKDGGLVASISLNRISRSLKQETEEQASDETILDSTEAAVSSEATDASAAPTTTPEESANASANAG